jgi:hypothetical protein
MTVDQEAKFKKDMHTTAACRFNAAKRLEARDRSLTRFTALSSAYLIALTILPYVWKLPTEVTDNFNLLTIVFSILILISSLLQYSKNDVVNAEQHHRGALEIKEIHRDLLMAQSPVPQQDLAKFRSRYDLVLQKYSLNHDDVDYMQYQVDRPEDFPWISGLPRCWIIARLTIGRCWRSFGLLVITAFVVCLVFLYAYPSRILSH